MVETKKLRVCPECGSSNVTRSKVKEQIMCRDCGLVFEELTTQAEKKFEKASDVI